MKSKFQESVFCSLLNSDKAKYDRVLHMTCKIPLRKRFLTIQITEECKYFIHFFVNLSMIYCILLESKSIGSFVLIYQFLTDII